MKQEPLAGLHDIHLPSPVSWWPPAPGWWLLMMLVLLATAALFWWLKWHQAKQAKAKQFSQRDMLKQASEELERLEKRASAESDACVAAELSGLLRRVAIQLKPDDVDIAGLSGDDWLIWLDGQWDNNAFSCGAGRAVLDAPYRRDGQMDISALLQIGRTWLQAQY